MNLIIIFIIPYCFGFIISRTSNNKDIASTVMALIGIIADLVLMYIVMGNRG